MFKESDIRDLEGTYVITGANAGIGFEAARMLSANGAHVILACRDEAKGKAAAKAVGGEFAQLDLADWESIHNFSISKADVLINNAGVMMPPRGEALGYEQQFGVNFVGHYHLTKQMDVGRVVTLSSIAHHDGRIDFDNLRLEKEYDRWHMYKQSKLADLIMAKQLAREGTYSIGAHPGVSKTELGRHFGAAFNLMAGAMGHKPAKAALSQVYAATMDVPPGSYWGPTGLKEYRGAVGDAKVDPIAEDEDLAKRLFAAVQ
jgi:NAD(P)-dependent dehydrogenase (short-subunit alcohol dehydrogenase family)